MKRPIPSVPSPSIRVCGDRRLLDESLLGVVSSTRTPLELYLPLVREIRWTTAVLAGPFQSPLERLILGAALSAGRQIVLFPARDPRRMRFPRSWEGAVEHGSLAVAAPADLVDARANRKAADLRDGLLAALVDELVIGAAVRGGRAYSVARALLERGGRVRCMDHPANADLLLAGCTPIPLAPFSPQDNG